MSNTFKFIQICRLEDKVITRIVVTKPLWRDIGQYIKTLTQKCPHCDQNKTLNHSETYTKITHVQSIIPAEHKTNSKPFHQSILHGNKTIIPLPKFTLEGTSSKIY